MGKKLTQKGGQSPQFSAHVYCGQTAGWIKMPLNTEIGLGLGDTVLDGDPAPLPKKGHDPQFSAHVRCGQTAGWIKIPRYGTEVRLVPGDIVLDGAQLPLRKSVTLPALIFSPPLLRPNGRPSQLLLSSCLKSQHLVTKILRLY